MNRRDASRALALLPLVAARPALAQASATFRVAWVSTERTGLPSVNQVILAFADGFTMGFAGHIAAFSLQHRIPAVDGWAPFAEQGNLMTYGPVLADVYRRLATHVDRIRKGAKPGDLPVELPTKLEFVINAKTANALGIAIPPGVLARADVVIR
jgi:putative ABC transport system substrate-binding protein